MMMGGADPVNGCRRAAAFRQKKAGLERARLKVLAT
jgi:hypothetical protein